MHITTRVICHIMQCDSMCKKLHKNISYLNGNVLERTKKSGRETNRCILQYSTFRENQTCD